MKGGTNLKKYSEFLYDDIGNTYKRKNLYLNDMAKLYTEYDETKNKQLLSQIKSIKASKSSHDYIVALRAYEVEKAKFKKDLSTSKKEFISQLDVSLSRKMKRLLTEQFEAEKRSQFYEAYKEFSYETKYEYEKSIIELIQYPEIIKHLDSNEKSLKRAITKGKALDPNDEVMVKKELHLYKKEQKIILNNKIAALKVKRKDRQISKKALQEGQKEMKLKCQEAIEVKSFELPIKSNKEKIKNRRFEIHTISKRRENVLKANIADLRRKVPLETEKQSTIIAFATFLIPGTGQLLNKQRIKGLLFLLIAAYIYMIAIPYALGYGNYQGEGVAGLINLAEGGVKLDKSLIFMIEGIIAIFLAISAVVLLYFSFIDVYRVEKAAIKGVRPKNWYETKTTISEVGFPYMVSLPALIVTVFIVLVPITTAILLSFTNMDPKHQSKFLWIGIENYIGIAKGEGIAGSAFWLIFWWTIIWTIFATTLAVAIGFILALILNNERIKGKTFFRSVYILPWAVPAFITIMFFSIMFSRNGIMTQIISDVFNPGGDLIEIKTNTTYIRIALICMQGWLGSSYVFLLSTGVLQAIPSDLYEAAQIDGASMFQKLRKITIPIVLFQTAPLLVGQYTFNFNNFSIIYLFNGGGPNNPSKYGNLAGSSDLLISYIYKLTMDNDFQAIGAAITIVISLGLMLFAFIGFKNSKAFKEEKL